MATSILKIILLSLFTFTAVIGCGQKGALYYPETKTEQSQDSSPTDLTSTEANESTLDDNIANDGSMDSTNPDDEGEQ